MTRTEFDVTVSRHRRAMTLFAAWLGAREPEDMASVDIAELPVLPVVKVERLPDAGRVRDESRSTGANEDDPREHWRRPAEGSPVVKVHGGGRMGSL